MKIPTKFIPVDRPSFVNRQIGSDRYSYEVTEVSEDGRWAKVYPVHGHGFDGSENPTTDFTRPDFWAWRYNGWHDCNGTGPRVSKRREFATFPASYLDPSF